MLSKLSGERKTDGRLDFAVRAGQTLVVVGQTGSGITFAALDYVVNESVMALEEMPVSGWTYFNTL